MTVKTRRMTGETSQQPVTRDDFTQLLQALMQTRAAPVDDLTLLQAILSNQEQIQLLNERAARPTPKETYPTIFSG